jgi:putative toxin-antitoxin system antitoxin component (TIGR02293 family)
MNAKRKQTRKGVHRDAPSENYPELPAHDEIMAGYRVTAVNEAADEYGISPAEMAKRVGIPRSTFHRKQKKNALLTGQESDMLARHSTLLKKATLVFEGDRDAARQWLSCPQIGLGGAVPLEFAKTTYGFLEVDKLLTRIDYSVYS